MTVSICCTPPTVCWRAGARSGSFELAVDPRQLFFDELTDVLQRQGAGNGLAEDVAHAAAEDVLALLVAQARGGGGDLHALAAAGDDDALALKFLVGAGDGVGVDGEALSQVA